MSDYKAHGLYKGIIAEQTRHLEEKDRAK